MRLLDRYIIKNFLINYLLAFGVMVGMFVLLDLIVNFEKFTKPAGIHPGNLMTMISVIADIADYYTYQLLVIFQLVAPAIPLLAAGFTMVRMTRHHELTAMLASGVSLYRVAAPIILCAIGFSLLVIVDQELLMPNCIGKLLRHHDEVGKTAAAAHGDALYFVREPDDNSLLMASRYDPSTRELFDVRIIKRTPDGMPTGRFMAASGRWIEATPENNLPHWHFKDTRQIDDAGSGDPSGRVAEVVGDFDYFNTKLTPEQLDLVVTKKAVEFLSSTQLQKLAAGSPDATKDSLIKAMHIRFTQPIMNLILLLIGIPFLLTREPGRLIFNLFYCTGVSAICFVATFVLFQMAGTILPPVLGAWLPVMLFGPLAAAMLDTIKT